MTKLLYIETSPLKSSSTTIDIARAFLDEYRGAHPSHEIDELDLWNVDLPPFDARMIEAKFAVLRAKNATAEQQAQWQRAVAISERLNSADHYLIGVPMWNFGIPYRLKHFIDVATLPGQNWSWSRETGYRGLLANKQATLIYSSANDYPLAPDEDPSDFQKPYLRRWLKFIGVAAIREIRVAPTLASPEAVSMAAEVARRQARTLAQA